MHTCTMSLGATLQSLGKRSGDADAVVTHSSRLARGVSFSDGQGEGGVYSDWAPSAQTLCVLAQDKVVLRSGYRYV